MAKSLTAYNRKRDFSQTPEPAGRSSRKRNGWRYLIQKHDATRLHYDFRLELDGVLKSWAVTKGPSLDPHVKRLAVRTEDHPLGYGDFEGTIPKGQYGGGTVMLWDEGTWEPVGDPHKGLEQGKLAFVLHGKRLKGGFALVRMHESEARSKGRENWLLIKHRDDEADTAHDPLKEWQDSVKSSRGMDEIAAAARPRKGPAKALRNPVEKRAGPKGKTRPLPGFVSPQLAYLRDKVPEGRNWIHEIKYDGYRALAAVADDRVRFYTRSGQDWTARFGGLVDVFRSLNTQALIDGEIIVLDDNGHSSFSLLQQVLSGEIRKPLHFIAFDLLSLDGRNIQKQPLVERKKKLKALIGKVRPGLSYGEHLEAGGPAAFAHACRLGIEGLVSKDRTSPYVSRRSLTWIKTKCLNRSEYVIGGFSPSDKKGRAFASLLIGEFDHGKLVYRGRVGTGFDAKMMKELAARLGKHAQAQSPFGQVPVAIARTAKWVKPAIVVEIAFTEKTPAGVLRHPALVGLREDKPARAVTGEDREGASMSKAADEETLEHVRLTHPGKLFYPDDEISKHDIAAYLQTVAPLMLPFVKNRPLSLMRCPDGIAAKCFFQKHATQGMPDAFKTVMLTEADGDRAEYLFVDSAEGIVSAAQIGALELHVWGASKDDLEHPDRMVFDLDPDPLCDFSEVKAAARKIADLLAAAGLNSVPMLSGGKGIHVIVPLDGRNDWAEVKDFSRALARGLAEREPAHFVATASKAERKGKIFIDWLRNERGATAIAPYSPRARKGATVAMPVNWDELAKIRSAAAFDIRTALKRIGKAGHSPWPDYPRRQHIGKETLAVVREL